MLRPGMRTYLVPLIAGFVLVASVFLPWIYLDGEGMAGFPGTASLWVIGLGFTASLLAVLSMITRRNSRHPLLLVGLVALGVTFLSWRVMPRQVEEEALTRSQALAIVRGVPAAERPEAAAGIGIYAGMVASAVITAFGLTIVVKRVSTPYVVDDPNDDV